MGWAAPYIEQLKQNQTVQFRPRGGSMKGKVESGNLVTVRPLDAADELSKGDIVLCTVNGSDYLHLVKAINVTERSIQVLIGNNRGGTNGWTPLSKVHGLCIKVEK